MSAMWQTWEGVFSSTRGADLVEFGCTVAADGAAAAAASAARVLQNARALDRAASSPPWRTKRLLKTNGVVWCGGEEVKEWRCQRLKSNVGRRWLHA